ncbi:MAG: hypothetical protein AAF849_06245 [Bacteroidota bacterium]
MNTLKLLLLFSIPSFFINLSFGQQSTQLKTDSLTFLENGLPKGSLSFDGLDLFLNNIEEDGYTVIGARRRIVFRRGLGSTFSMAIDESGNLGIGTSSPDQELDVRGDIALTDGAGRIEFKNGNDVNAFIDWDGIDLSLQNDTNEEADISLNAEDDIFFQTGSSNTVRMLISESGNVGIGTPSPDERLHVVGNAILQNGNPKLEFMQNSGDLYGSILGINSDIVFENTIANNGRLIFDADRGFNFRRNSNSETLMNFEVSTERLYIGDNAPALNPAIRLYVEGGAFFGHQITAVFPPGGGSTVVTDPNGKLFKESSSNRYISKVKNLKTDFSQILNIQPKTYVQKENPGRQEIGVIAEDVEKLGLKDLIVYDQKGLPDGVQYRKMALYLIPVVKEQQETIKTQTAQIQQLEDRLAKLEQLFNNINTEEIPIQKEAITLSQNFQLQQNHPNPFSQWTRIDYFIPDEVKQAKIQVQDINGKLLKVIEIAQKGSGTIDLQAANLAAGQYSYSLILDGKIVETKQMMVSQ